MSFFRKYFALLLVFILSAGILLTGCAAGEKTGVSKDSNESAGRTSARVINHAMGTTEIKGTPERVVVLFSGAVDISLALGVKPVGAVESWIGNPWYDYIKRDMAGVTVLGQETQPNLEKIVALKPDLIIGSKARHEKIYQQLSAIAPTVMTEVVFDWKTHVTLMGKALNKEAEADKIMSDWNKRVADFKQKMGSKLSTEVSLIRFNPDSARIYYTGFPGGILEDLGLSRPAAQRVKDKVVVNLTSKENIPNLDGDIIVDLTADWQKDGKALKVRNEWKDHPLWQNLRAVKNGKVYDVNEVYWNMSGGVMAANLMLDDLYRIFGLE